MPNWTHNHLELFGDELAITNFKDLTRYHTFNEEDEQPMVTYSILSTFLPTPTELVETVKGSFSNEERKQLLKEQQERNIIKYGHKDWYDWNYENWGCKWSDCETTLQGDTYSFLTPWSPPVVGIRNISKMFPLINFILSFTEEANLFIGACLIVDGMIFEEIGDTNVVTPFVEEDDYAKYSQAIQDERERCAATLYDNLQVYKNLLN